MTRKILSSVICLLLVASTMITVSCAGNDTTDGSGQNNNTNNPGGNTTTPGSSAGSDYDIDPQMLTLNFSDEGTPTVLTFAFSESGETEENFTLRSIAPDDIGDDSVSAALDMRNTTIESLYGVEIDAYKASDSIQGLQGAIQTQMAGQDPEIDVIVGYQYYDIGMATQGWLVNYANMTDNDGNKINYVDYDGKAYWGNAYIDALSYKGIVYWVTGDLALRFIGGTYCTFVNKALYDEYLEPTYGSIYDIVKQGNWTLETLYTMAGAVWQDTNGNSEVDKEDVVGYVWESNDCTDALAIASQVPFSSKSADNTSVTITLNSTRTVTFIGELEKLLYGERSLLLGDQDSTLVMTNFTAGNSAFVINKVFKAERYLTDMTDDFMIVPVPKMNADQSEYTTLIHDGCSIYGISYFSDAKAAAAATLEYMAYLSHKDVFSLYYDQALKSKYTNDPTSADMIELIHQNIKTDFVVAWSGSIENIAHWFRSHNKTTGASRDLNRYAPVQQSALEKLLADLEAYSDL